MIQNPQKKKKIKPQAKDAKTGERKTLKEGPQGGTTNWQWQKGNTQHMEQHMEG